jgi:opacity protein-like surface antigen
LLALGGRRARRGLVSWAKPLDEKWSLRVEYLRTDLGDMTFDTGYRAGSTFPGYSENVRQDLTLQTVQLGVSYKF